MFLDYFALAVLLIVVLVCFYGIIVIHDIPYEIAVKRDHPHQDAIHAAGWVSLFTLHAIWPFLRSGPPSTDQNGGGDFHSNNNSRITRNWQLWNCGSAN